MAFSEYQDFLPGGDRVRRLIAWIKNYVGGEFQWELQLILRAVEVPRLCLGKMGQLGWTTWLSTQKYEKDADHLMLRSLSA